MAQERRQQFFERNWYEYVKNEHTLIIAPILIIALIFFL